MAGEQSLKLCSCGRCNWGAGGGVSNRADSLPVGEAGEGERRTNDIYHMQPTSLTEICTAAISSWLGDYYLSVPAVTWRTPVINYPRVFSPASIILLAPWQIICVGHLNLGDQLLVGVVELWLTPSHLLRLPKRQEVPVDHLPPCMGVWKDPLPPCTLIAASLPGSVFGATMQVPGRRRRAWLSHRPEQMARQSCAPASDSKHQGPLFPGLRENRWVTRRQLQKVFSRLCLCNGLKKKERKKKKKERKKKRASY